MSIKGLLIAVLAVIGLAAIGNAVTSGGSAGAHGGDSDVVHLCVSKVGSLKSAFVVSPNTNCPGIFYDSVHVPLADTSMPQDRTCPAGEFVNGIAADGSLICESVLTMTSFYAETASYNGTVGVGEVTCDSGDVAVGGGASAVNLSGTGPGSNGILGNDLTGWIGGGNQFLAAAVVCLDLSPLRDAP